MAPGIWADLTEQQKRHPLARYFIDRIGLGPLSGDEVEETVLSSLAGTGVSFSPAIVGKVFEHTQGHPFEMQVLCYHLFGCQLSGRVDEQVWEKALETAVKHMGHAIFDEWYDRASAAEAKVLRAVAAMDGPATTRAIQEATRTGELKTTPSSVAKHVQRLKEKGLITRATRGAYEISDAMFRTYVRLRTD